MSIHALLSPVFGGQLSACEILLHRSLDQSDAYILELTEAGRGVIVFLKTSQVRRLAARGGGNDESWARAVCSWINERRFYSHAAALVSRCVRVPSPIRAWCTASSDGDALGDEHCVLLEYLSPADFTAPDVLTPPEARLVLRSLAALHAETWVGATGHPAAGLCLERGCWWKADRGNSIELTCQQGPAVWRDLLQTFSSLAQHGLGSPAALDAINWLACTGADITRELSQAPTRCMLHGDAKAANALLPLHGAAGAVLLDWQWCGGGASGAADVAYLLAGSLQPVAGAQLLRELRGDYWRALEGELSARGIGAMYTEQAFLRDFRLEWLGFVSTTVLPSLLRGLTPAVMAVNMGRHGWLSFERCEASLALLLQVTLSMVEEERQEREGTARGMSL